MTKRHGSIRRAKSTTCCGRCGLTNRTTWRRSRCRARSTVRRTTPRHALLLSKLDSMSVKPPMASQFVHPAKDRNRVYRRVEWLSSEFAVGAFDAEENSLRLSPIRIRAEVDLLRGFKRRESDVVMAARFRSDIFEVSLHLARPLLAA